jgi:baculoviral IAP repeat-containing protein 6
MAPKMFCRTAATTRECDALNPNLHGDGKGMHSKLLLKGYIIILYANFKIAPVCLSLLGTWPGAPEEQWQPGKSTVLSVLTSIQAMIFCEDPYRNEPGFDKASGFSASRRAKDYATMVQQHSVKYGIVRWLEQGEDQRGIWADIIKAHFAMNKAEILEMATKRSSDWGRSDRKLLQNLSQVLNTR